MNQLKRWIPVFIWAVLMSLASTDSFSEAHTSKIALPLFRFLLPHASLATLEWLHFVIRKCAKHAVPVVCTRILELRVLITAHSLNRAAVLFSPEKKAARAFSKQRPKSREARESFSLQPSR